MTLADLFNAPTEFELDGEKFHIRKPNLLEQGEFQRWLEQLAFEAIDRRNYQDDTTKLACLRQHDLDVASGTFEWGGEIATRRLMTAKGLAQLLSIICREQGLTEKKAEKLVDQEQRKIAAVLVSKATTDPKALEAALTSLGLPKDFLSQASATHPSADPKTSSPSADSATTSS